MKKTAETILHLAQAGICAAGPFLMEPAEAGLALAAISVVAAVRVAGRS